MYENPREPQKFVHDRRNVLDHRSGWLVLVSSFYFMLEIEVREKKVRVAVVILVDPVVRFAQFLLYHIAGHFGLHCSTVTRFAKRLHHHPD